MKGVCLGLGGGPTQVGAPEGREGAGFVIGDTQADPYGLAASATRRFRSATAAGSYPVSRRAPTT